MHQSFVTTAPMGPENSADIDISLQSPGICLALRKHFYDKSSAKRPAQILACKCEITLGMTIKRPMSIVPRHCGDDVEVKTWHLTPAMFPAPMGRGYKQQVHNAHHF